MKSLFVFIVLSIPIVSIGQLSILPVSTDSNPSGRTAQVTTIADTLSLPFWDDFSQSQGTLDSSRWQYDSQVFINNSLAIDPPTIFVATFDGVDGNGKPYNQNTSFSALADVLESQPIDLTKVPESRRSTVYFSFYWQLQGFGELPDEEDSLQLQFFRSDSVWVTQDLNEDEDHLALAGGIDPLVFGVDSVFTQILIPISGELYFHRGFRFRFRSFSNLSGIYDTWHIDYVYINEFRNANDRAVIDRALTGKPSLLFDPYYEMPLDQLLQNPGAYLSTPIMGVSNLGANLRPVDPFHHYVNLITGETTVLLDTLPQITVGGFEVGKPFSGKDLSSLDLGSDSIFIESKFSLFTGDTLLSNLAPDGSPLYYPVDLKVNDTLSNRYTLHNYFSYDDGGAEFAAGINLIGGRLAVAFFVEQPDFISDLMIHFPAVSPSSEGQTIDVEIWNSLDDDFPVIAQPTVIGPANRNQFQTIELNRPIFVSDTFYIGYKQFTNNYIGIGFDRNNMGGANKIWTNVDQVWEQNNRLAGSMMIRPVFDATQEEKDSSITGTREINEFKVFPNPASSFLRITGPHDRVIIVGIDGRIYFQSDFKKYYDIRHLPRGLYILRIYDNDLISTRKIILTHDDRTN